MRNIFYKAAVELHFLVLCFSILCQKSMVLSYFFHLFWILLSHQRLLLSLSILRDAAGLSWCSRHCLLFELLWFSQQTNNEPGFESAYYQHHESLQISRSRKFMWIKWAKESDPTSKAGLIHKLKQDHVFIFLYFPRSISGSIWCSTGAHLLLLLKTWMPRTKSNRNRVV